MEENNIDVLDELHKGCDMGMDAIKLVLDKAEGKEFKKILKEQYNDYEEIADEIEEIYADYSERKPHEAGVMTKAMTWYGIQMNTLADKSNSKLADLLSQGTNMGIIEGRKLLNHKDSSKEIEALVKKYIKVQEHSIEKLKDFL